VNSIILKMQLQVTDSLYIKPKLGKARKTGAVAYISVLAAT
jgi:hypothetical protein